MTKEAKELLTHVCRDGVWGKERDMTEELEETLDLIQGRESNLFKPLQGFCVVGRRFSTEQECKDFSNAVRDLSSIMVSYTVETGAGGHILTGSLFGAVLVHGTDFFIQVDRTYLFVLISGWWSWSHGNKFGDFIDYVSRNKGKYWDRLIRPIAFDEFNGVIWTDGEEDE